MREFRAAFKREREAARDALAREQAAVQQLSRQINVDRESTKAAGEEVRVAREELSAYRRVLAAAVANEKRSQGDVETARTELRRVEGELHEAIAARGVATGRSEELAAALTRAEQALADARSEHDRALASAVEHAQAVHRELRSEHERTLARTEERAARELQELRQAHVHAEEDHRRSMAEADERQQALREELQCALLAATEEGRQQLAEAERRAQERREELRNQLRESEHERGVAFGRVAELLTRIPKDLSASARAAMVRAQVCLGVGVLMLSLWLGLLPVLAIALFSRERAGHLSAATGLSTPGMVVLELVLLCLSLGIGSWGLRELRRGEREAEG